MTAQRARLVLVRPPVDVQHKFSKGVESLALGALAAAARLDGHEVELVDSQLYGWDEAQTAERILQARPDVVGFTVTVNQFPPQLATIAGLLRDGGFGGVSLVGGHAVSFFPARIVEAVPQLDGAVAGEGEQVIRFVLAAVAAGADWRRTPGVTAMVDGEAVSQPPVRIGDLARLPWAARDLMPDVIRLDAIPAIATSRGCYARCSFCSVPRFYGLDKGKPLASGAWLARPARDVVAEIVHLHDSYGIDELLIVDDEFFGGSEAGHQRATEISDRLTAAGSPVRFAISCRAENVTEPVMRRLRLAGLSHVFIGVESGSSDDLRFYAKGHSVAQNADAVRMVKDLGLTVQCGFMMFTPDSTLRTLRENVRFLEQVGELKPVSLNSTVDPHFGTPLIRRMARDGVLADHGLSLSTFIRDPAARSVKQVAQRVTDRYIGYMNFLAGVRSSITWEWRRPVPGRSAPTERVLDTFEAAVNTQLAGLVVTAIDAVAAGATQAELNCDLDAGLDQVRARLDLGRALVVSQLEATEGTLRYWSHADLIEHQRAGERAVLA